MTAKRVDVDPRGGGVERVGEAAYRRLTSRNSGLDLLRAAGAALVFATHLYHGFGQTWLGPLAAGGWLGVYIFFPLSGYLLSRPFGIDTPNLGRYAANRLARILPAYYLALLGIAMLGGATITIPALTMTANTFGRETMQQSWFGQSWTLGVEMLFYLLLPLLVRLRTAAIAVVVVGSLVLAMSVPGDSWWHDQIPTQLWAFGAGVLAARWHGQVRGWPVAIAVLVVALAMPPTQWALRAAAATGAATWLILAAAHARPTTRWARWPADLSYAVYLWHVAVTAVLYRAGVTGAVLVPAAALGTIGVAFLSFRYVERPVLRWVARGLRIGVGVTPRQVGEAGV